MQAFRIMMIVTPEDRKRAEDVAAAEAKARKQKTPEFIRQGLGACSNVEFMDDFTNDSRRGRAPVQARARAAALCGRCPFAAECLPWAEQTEQSGVFGGVWLVKGEKQEERYAA